MFLLKGFIDFLTVYFRKPKFMMMALIIAFTAITVMSVFGTRIVTDIPVYVVDHDNSTISRTLRLYLDASPDLHVLGTVQTPDEAKQLLYDGQIGGIIYIPSGLSQAVKTQSGGRVFTYIDGTNMLMAKNVGKAVQTVVKTTSVGVSMIAIQKQGVPEQALMGAVQPINLDVDRPFNALTVYSDYLLPVLIFFCLNIFTCIMTCGCYQEDIPQKIKSHKLRKRFYYIGRLIAVFIVAFLLGILIYKEGLPRIDIVLQSTPLMALSALTVYLVMTMCMFSIIYLILPASLAMSVCYLTCMLSVMLSGLTWPLEMMPWYLQEFASWIPLTPFLQSVQVFLYHDATWGDLSDFYQMFLKQAVLYIICLFAIMRTKDLKLIAKWIIHKIKREREIHNSLEMAAADASPKLSSLLLDKEREAIRSSQMLNAVSRDIVISSTLPDLANEAIKEDDLRTLTAAPDAPAPIHADNQEELLSSDAEISLPEEGKGNPDSQISLPEEGKGNPDSQISLPNEAKGNPKEDCAERQTVPPASHSTAADENTAKPAESVPTPHTPKIVAPKTDPISATETADAAESATTPKEED